LASAAGSQPSRIDHHGSRVLHRGAAGGPCETWQAGNLQLGSGQPFTSADFTSVLLKNGIAISMDGKGSWRDNVFIERLWRSVKWEEVYLRAYDTVSEARTSIGSYLSFYNSGRPHSSLDRQTPDQVYFNRPLLAAAA
jgi:putative transposase